MGLFDKFRNSKSQERTTKLVSVDNIYLLDVPTNWEITPSDRFRMVNKENTIHFSATNFAKPITPDFNYGIEKLTIEIEELFLKFKNEGGFISSDDRVDGANYLYESFKVGEETQYYFYSFHEAFGKIVRVNLVLREIGEYKRETKTTLLEMGQGLKIKVG